MNYLHFSYTKLIYSTISHLQGSKMKKLLILTLIFFTSISQADFIDAQKHYQNQEFKKAYNEFNQLAKLGNQKSQYNVALMNYNGQGTDKNAIEAYAWVSLVTDIAKYQPLFNVIRDELSPNELIQAQKLAVKHKANYAYENSKVILGPIVDNGSDSSEVIINRPVLISDKRTAPNFPKDKAI